MNVGGALLSIFGNAAEGGAKATRELAEDRIKNKFEAAKEEALFKRQQSLAEMADRMARERDWVNNERSKDLEASRQSAASTEAELARKATSTEKALDRTATAEEKKLDRANDLEKYKLLAGVRANASENSSDMKALELQMKAMKAIEDGTMRPEQANAILKQMGVEPLVEVPGDTIEAPWYKPWQDDKKTTVWVPPNSTGQKADGMQEASNAGTPKGGEGKSTPPGKSGKTDSAAIIEDAKKKAAGSRPLLDGVEPTVKVNPALPADPTTWDVDESNRTVTVNGKTMPLTWVELGVYQKAMSEKERRTLSPRDKAYLSEITNEDVQ